MDKSEIKVLTISEMIAKRTEEKAKAEEMLIEAQKEVMRLRLEIDLAYSLVYSDDIKVKLDSEYEKAQERVQDAEQLIPNRISALENEIGYLQSIVL